MTLACLQYSYRGMFVAKVYEAIYLPATRPLVHFPPDRGRDPKKRIACTLKKIMFSGDHVLIVKPHSRWYCARQITRGRMKRRDKEIRKAEIPVVVKSRDFVVAPGFHHYWDLR